MSTEVTLFESYEQDFNGLLLSIQSKLSAATSQGIGESPLRDPRTNADDRIEQRKASIRRAELEMDEADDMVRYLNIILAVTLILDLFS